MDGLRLNGVENYRKLGLGASLTPMIELRACGNLKIAEECCLNFLKKGKLPLN